MLGLGDNSNRDVPTQIPLLEYINQISASQFHSLFLSNGTVYAVGNNDVIFK
jgi:alpha-tubulin suppressor-like RCC1 family protein